MVSTSLVEKRIEGHSLFLMRCCIQKSASFALTIAGLVLYCSPAGAANVTPAEAPGCRPGGPPAEAIASCTKILSLPDVSNEARQSAFLIRGNAYLAESELALAGADYIEAQKISYSVSVGFALGGIYINQGKSEEAISELGKIIDSGNATAEVFNARGMAFENAGKYDDAIADFNKALFLAPALLGPVNNRAAAYAKQGNYQAAEKDIDLVLAKNPDMPVALVNRCDYQAHAGKLELGRQSCDRAEHLAPDNYFILQGIGFVYYQSGLFQDAIAYFNKSLRLHPKDAAALYGRGRAKAKLGISDSESDIAAAEQIQPNIAAFLATSGLK